jgi:ribosomal protein S18 acetylase RimI-like enzyme
VSTIRSFRPEDTESIVQLWRDCGLTRAWNDPHKDIARKLTVQPELFLVAEDAGVVIGTAMVGFDGHRGWVYYFAVATSRRGEGHGSQLMAEAERLLVERGCPKIMLMVRDDNSSVVELYRHLGYEREQTLLLGKRVIPDVAGNDVDTPTP